MIKIIFLVFSLLFLIYLLVPGPTSIKDFPALPNSYKSTLEGDTIQVQNVSAYFSNNYRDFSTNYYRQIYKDKIFLPFPPLRLNYPPEFAFTAIKDQTQSTYLEEMVYPLRESLFINGLEPYYSDGTPKYWGATHFSEGGKIYDTKVTLRFYPSPLWIRILVWFGINLSIILIWKLGRRIFR